MDVKCFLSYKRLHTQVIIVASLRHTTRCKQVQLDKSKSTKKSNGEEVSEEEPATQDNWGRPNLSRSHQLLLSPRELEELLIAFPTVDSVAVNEDLIQELAHRFTANPTLKAIVMATDAKMFEDNLWTVSDLSVAVSTDPSSCSLGVRHAVVWGFLLYVK